MSSLRGARIDGKRRFSASTMAAVSSTERVVWVRKARFSVPGTATTSASSTVSTSVIDPVGTSERADHFGMTGVADEQDMPTFLDQPLRLAMDFRDQGAGRVD